MAIETTDRAEATRQGGRYRDPYVLHRLHSLSGIVPIGIFLIQHLIANSYVLRGERSYNTVISVFGYLPFVVVLEIAVIYIPILFHAVYGFYIMSASSPNTGSYGYSRNWMYFLQRVTGVIAFFYIGFHIWHTSLQKYINQWHHLPHPERAIEYQSMAGQMADPLTFLIYAVGIVATVFHLTNGIWNFCIRWGITISPRSQQVTSWVCWALFALFSLIGLASANHLRLAGLNHDFAPAVTASAF